MLKFTLWILSMVMIVFFMIDSEYAYPKNTETVVVYQMNSNTWMATDKRINVVYGNVECPVVAENVLRNVVDDSNAGVFDWYNMGCLRFRYDTLHNECVRLKSEMKRLKDINKGK